MTAPQKYSVFMNMRRISGNELRKGSLAELFFTFAKAEVLTFDGGYAMIPIFERELVDKRA